MIQRVLNSKNFLAVLLAMATGTVLCFKMPWPMTASLSTLTWDEYFLRLIALRDPWTYAALKASYHVMLFTTPYIGYSLLLSALYIFTLRPRRTAKPQPLPPYPPIETRNELCVVIGEIHNPRRPIPSENPYWLSIPARGLFTGTIIIGATGSGKTASSMYPFTEQLLGYKAEIPDERLSGIILEVKGDFCGKVRAILKQHGRESDYVSISLTSEWAYNPLQNELDGYSMAVGIANLLNSLFGKGKEPFWQQAYTNLVKFTIILHKVAFGYVTLFDVYESAISARVLETKIRRAEENILGKSFATVPREVFESHARELAEAGFEADESGGLYRALNSPAARDVLQKLGIEPAIKHEGGPDGVDEDRKERLEAVKRWYYDDWSNIDRKLQSSVVEGISVFLSLFDDNPPIKRLFCPPSGTVRTKRSPRFVASALCRRFESLLESGKIVALDFPAGENPGLARAVAVMLKMDFQRAMLNRIARMAAEPAKTMATRAVYLRRISASGNGDRTRAERRRPIFQPLAPGKMHSHRRNTEHQFLAVHVAR